jgi:hypothetical protein
VAILRHRCIDASNNQKSMESREVPQSLCLPSCPSIVKNLNFKLRILMTAYAQSDISRSFFRLLRDGLKFGLDVGLGAKSKNAANENILLNRQVVFIKELDGMDFIYPMQRISLPNSELVSRITSKGDRGVT